MESLKAALAAYAFTIVFAMAIACCLPLLGWVIKKMKLDQAETLDITVPTSNSLKEEEAIAVAIAVARAQRK